MQIQEIMTSSPITIESDSSLQEAASAMAAGDFGAIAVVDGQERPIGILTDRDIAVRGVAQGLSPESDVASVMSDVCLCIEQTVLVEQAIQLMEQQQIRRLVAVDGTGTVTGMVSLGDISQATDERYAGKTISEISKPKS